MALHIIKLCVGAESISDLASWQQQRLKALKKARQTPELMHVTRFMPKRAGEVLDGGSLYWVIKGRVAARQKLLELRQVVKDGSPHCGLVYDSELIPVRPHPHRPFQGWRYLEGKDAPPDLPRRAGGEDLPEELLRDLAELGLV